ncbi:MAG TPA: hypothetical protein VGK53_05045, partial [Propionicimonas sp.]
MDTETQNDALTDENLTEMVEWAARYDGDIASVLAEVVAALRASRAEVERLRTADHFVTVGGTGT